MCSIFDYALLLIISIIGVIGAVSVFRNAHRQIDTVTLFISFLLLYHGAGACFSFVFADPFFIDQLRSTYDIEKNDLARACLALILFASVLAALRWRFREWVVISRKELDEIAAWSSRSKTFEIILAISTAIQLYVIKTGKMGFEGVLLDSTSVDVGMASPWALLSSWLCVALAPACVFIMAARQRISAVLLLGALWNMGIVVMSGRRCFLSVAFLSMLPLFIFPFSNRMRASFLVSGAAAAGAAMVLFFALRLSMGDGQMERTDFKNLFSNALNLFSNSGSSSYAKEQLVANTTTRTFNLGYTSAIAKNARIIGGANGLILKYSSMGALPGFLFPQKYMFTLMGGEEAVAIDVLGLDDNGDENNSAVTAAMTDLGWFGLIAYASILFAVIAAAIWLVRKTKRSELGLVAVFYLCYTLTFIEAEFSNVFISLRFIATLCVIGMIVVRFQYQDDPNDLPAGLPRLTSIEPRQRRTRPHRFRGTGFASRDS